MKTKYRNIYTGEIATKAAVEELPEGAVCPPLSGTVYTLSNGSRWDKTQFYENWEQLHPFYNQPFEPPRVNPRTIAGFEILVSDAPIGHKQFRFPRTKKVRIRKKWAKRRANYKPIYIDGVLLDEARRVIYCTSATAERIRRSVG